MGWLSFTFFIIGAYEFDLKQISAIASPINESFFLTPANFCELPFSFISLSYSRPYSLDEVVFLRGQIGLKKYRGGIYFQSLGCSPYFENQGGVGFGFKFNQFFQYGFLVKLYYPQLKNYWSDIFYSFNLGGAIKIQKHRFYLSLKNINQPQNRFGEELSFQFLSGAILVLDPKLKLNPLYERGRNERFHFGLEYEISESFNFGAEVITNPLNYNLKIDLLANEWLLLNYHLNFHPILKETHILTLSFKFK